MRSRVHYVFKRAMFQRPPPLSVGPPISVGSPFWLSLLFLVFWCCKKQNWLTIFWQYVCKIWEIFDQYLTNIWPIFVQCCCHTRLHLGFSTKLKIWQVPTCKMDPWSGIILWIVTHQPTTTHSPTHHPPTHSSHRIIVFCCEATVDNTQNVSN